MLEKVRVRMAYYSQTELSQMGFKYLGKEVLISTKASLYDIHLIEIGDYCRIDDFCLLSGVITLGRNVHIAPYTNIAGGEKGVTIGDFSGLAYRVTVFSQSDDYSGESMTNPTIPDEFKNESKEKVVIREHVIIGSHSIVFPGVDIAIGTSVGAMSMVTKSTLEWSVYFGSPARRLKSRSTQLLDLCRAYLEGAGSS